MRAETIAAVFGSKKSVTVLILPTFILLMAGCCKPPHSSYSITELGTLGGGGTIATAINNRGEVVGESTLPSSPDSPIIHAFLWEKGKMTDLGSLGDHSQSSASGINDSGSVVGRFGDPQAQGNGYTFVNGFVHGFIWQNGVMTDIGVLPGDENSFATGINSIGQVVGVSSDKSGLVARAFIYRGGGTPVSLGSLGGPVTEATGINDSGIVVGWGVTPGFAAHDVFSFQMGLMVDLVGQAYARALNASGQIAGEMDVSGYSQPTQHAFRYSQGIVHDLGSLGGRISYSTSINVSGDVVGSSLTIIVDKNGQPYNHAFISGTRPFGGACLCDLNNLIPPSIEHGKPEPLWQLWQANGINDSGQIVGLGILRGKGVRAFMLTPK